MSTATRPYRFRLARGRLTMRSAMLLVALAALALWTTRRVVENLTPRATVVTRQLQTLRQSSSDERIEAAIELGQVEPTDVARVLPQLVRSLADSDVELRRAVSQSMASLAREGVPETSRQGAARTLLDFLSDEDDEVRCNVALTLGLLARSKDDAVPPAPVFQFTIPGLMRALKDENPFVRAAAAESLAWVVPRELGAPAELIEAATSEPNVYVRRAAIDALGHPWANQDAVQHTLLSLLRRPRALVSADLASNESEQLMGQSGDSRQALEMLKRIGHPTEATLTELADVIITGPRALSPEALELVRSYKQDGRAILHRLAEILTDPETSFRIGPGVSLAIREIDSASPEAHFAMSLLLEDYLHTTSVDQSLWLQREILSYRAPLESMIPRLREALASGNSVEKEAALRLLEEIDPDIDFEDYSESAAVVED
jgi:HEAT repeat protein